MADDLSSSSTSPHRAHGRSTHVRAARIRIPKSDALIRARVDGQLMGVWEHPVTLVVAPAGSGKTTHVAQFARHADAPVAWYRAEAADTRVAGTLAHLEQACRSAFEPSLPIPDREWATVDDMVDALERVDVPAHGRALIVVDDLHTLLGTEAETAIAQLCSYAPDWLHIVLVSRAAPGFNVSRWRVSGQLLDVTTDDLRFRIWEIESLFRDFYAEPLPPTDLAALARRVEGWAAGLQLFHLASRGKTTSERRQLISELGARSRLVREYLTRNVLDELPQALRDFLLHTSVLGRLTAPIANALLDRNDSQSLLVELERRQVFTATDDDGETFRYHEVFRSHLEALLVDEIGEPAVANLSARAGALLETAGAIPEALRAYSRANDWDAATRLLGRSGQHLVSGMADSVWIDHLPPARLQQDPWLMLAHARRRVAHGQFDEAIESYAAALHAFHDGTGAEIARRERHLVLPWASVEAAHVVMSTTPDWSSRLRVGVRKQTTLASRDAHRPDDAAIETLADAIVLLVGGRLREAEQVLANLDWDASTGPVVGNAIGLVHSLIDLLRGAPQAIDHIEHWAESAQHVAYPFLARIGRSLVGLTGECSDHRIAAGARIECKIVGDRWGAAIAGLIAGLSALRAGDQPVELLDQVADDLVELDAPLLEAWARAGAALAQARAATESDASTIERTQRARRLANGAGSTIAEAMSLLALDALEPMSGHDGIAREHAHEGGFEAWIAALRADRPPAVIDLSAPPAPPSAYDAIRVRSLGTFDLSIGDAKVDLSHVKPRAREALRVLVSRAGQNVHREELIEALWPEVDLSTGTRNLQVAISSLRRALEPDADRGSSTRIVRDGDSYRFAVHEGDDVDVVAFRQALMRARAASIRGDRSTCRDELRRALEGYRGDLMVEDGPAEWVIGPREQLREDMLDAAHSLAELLIEDGDAKSAAAVCRHALAHDRYRDQLWRTAIDALRRSGDVAAALRAERDYETMLGELGLHRVS